MDHLAPQIARLFEESRDQAGEPVPEYFLDGLVSGSPRSVDDSFRGKWRKVRFLRRVELEFEVCLSEADLERRWRFNEFVERVAERRAAPDINRRSVAKRLRAEKRADLGLFLMIAALGGGIALILPGFFAILPLTLAAGMLALLLLIKAAAVRHYKALRDKIA